MSVHLSVHDPGPGRERDLIPSMGRFGGAAVCAPGYGASWRAGVEAMRAAVTDDPFEEWEEREAESSALVDVWRST